MKETDTWHAHPKDWTFWTDQKSTDCPKTWPGVCLQPSDITKSCSSTHQVLDPLTKICTCKKSDVWSFVVVLDSCSVWSVSVRKFGFEACCILNKFRFSPCHDVNQNEHAQIMIPFNWNLIFTPSNPHWRTPLMTETNVFLICRSRRKLQCETTSVELLDCASMHIGAPCIAFSGKELLHPIFSLFKPHVNFPPSWRSKKGIMTQLSFCSTSFSSWCTTWSVITGFPVHFPHKICSKKRTSLLADCPWMLQNTRHLSGKATKQRTFSGGWHRKMVGNA